MALLESIQEQFRLKAISLHHNPGAESVVKVEVSIIRSKRVQSQTFCQQLVIQRKAVATVGLDGAGMVVNLHRVSATGGRSCLLVALVSGALAALGGGLLGLFAAYRGGLWDEVISRVVEMKIAIPSILFVSLFVTGFGQSVVVLVVVIMLIKMMGVIRTARAQGLVLMSQGFIIAAKLRGESASRIIVREMLPNILDLLGVEFALRTSSALLLVSTLSFLGLGLSPPTPDWGLMVHDGLQSIRSQPWLILVPAGCITSLVVGVNFATEGVVDAFGMEHARGVAGH